MDKEVVAVSIKNGKYFVVFEDKTRIRVDSDEIEQVEE